MRRFWIILVTVFCMTAAGDAWAQLQWRETTHQVTGRSLTDPSYTDGVEVFGNDGVITIRTSRRIQVRVFTILGQLISNATLNPGTSELRIRAHGVYILKIGNITQKVAL